MASEGVHAVWFLPSAPNAKVMKFKQARVNGGSNYVWLSGSFGGNPTCLEKDVFPWVGSTDPIPVTTCTQPLESKPTNTHYRSCQGDLLVGARARQCMCTVGYYIWTAFGQLLHSLLGRRRDLIFHSAPHFLTTLREPLHNIYIYIYVHTHVHMYIYTDMHTYINTTIGNVFLIILKSPGSSLVPTELAKISRSCFSTLKL